MLKIGNAQGFWGDSVGAAARLAAQDPTLDYITLDYLAEVTLSLMAMQKERIPSLGYATDFIDELRLLVPFWQKGSKLKVVANAGGLSPLACARAAAAALQAAGCPIKKIGVVYGDNVLDLIKSGGDYPNLDTGESIDRLRDSLCSANAYLGAAPIAEALNKGADIVITGRVADPSLVTACCLSNFGWAPNDYDKIAQATVAGHLIECGVQATGGISTNWLLVPELSSLGFPVIEMEKDGSFVLTKPAGTGGLVNEEIVKEQLLYELGDPGQYLSPDATVSLLSLKLEAVGENRIRVLEAKGSAPPPTLKVSATYRDGYMAEGVLTFFGRHIVEKAKRAGEIVLERVENSGFSLQETRIECLGTGAVAPGVVAASEVLEVVLRVSVKDQRKEAVERFAKEIAPLVTGGPQGTTGYFSGRPKVKRVFGFWPCLIPVEQVFPLLELIEVG